MKRVCAGVLIWLVVVMVAPIVAWAQVRPALIIVGIQTGGVQSASQERIELANTTVSAIDLAAYQLQYFAAQPKDMQKPSRTIALSGTVNTGEVFTLGTDGEVDIDQKYGATLAAAGGHLRLMRGTSVIDLVGWGTAAHAQGKAASAPAAGDMMSRYYDSQTNTYSVTGSNAEDFTEAKTADVVRSGAVQLAELLPNPASPATDAADEFIEVYNAGPEAIDLTGYRFVVGSTSQRSYTLQGIAIAPGEYYALFSAQTKLALGNAGSTVKLLDANGTALDEVAYDAAAEGQAYAWDGQGWQWTTAPTPGQANTIDVPAEAGAKAAKTTTKKAAAKTTKAKATKSTKKSAVKSNAAKKAAQQTSQKEQIKPPLHTGVVAGVGGAAVLYGAYEYRQDAFNLYRKLRGDRKVR